jgi:hypothetical protein
MRAALILAAAFVAQTGAPSAQQVASAPVAEIRALDKTSGLTEDIEIATGTSVAFGRITVAVSDCRYPVDDPSSNAFAHLTITHSNSETPEFDGWMVAQSPALSALDDPRYDVWLLRCKSS